MQIDGTEGTLASEPNSRIVKLRLLLCRWVPAAAIICFLAWCFVSVRPDFSWDDAEPEILNQAWRLAKGESVYHGIETPPFAYGVYPPLYYGLVAFLLKFTGLSFIPAKFLSFLAALSIGWALIRLNREWNNVRYSGIWSAFFLFLIPAFLYNATRTHVQMTAVALSIWSLAFFLRNRWTATVLISPLFAVLALYTKQTQLALPLAMVIYLALRNRRWLLPYISTFVVAGGIPFLLLQKLTDGYFFFNTFELARLSYNVLQIPLIFIHHAGPVLILICLALTIAWKRFKKGTWDAVDCYLCCVLATTLFSLGRVGAHGQYVVELLVVVLLFLMRTVNFPAIKGRDALICVQILILFIYAPAFIFVEEGLWDIPANTAASKIYGLMRPDPGPILSQQGSFALFGSGEIFIQLFDFAALSRAGLWDQNLLLRKIEKHTFPYVITEFDIDNSELSENALERFTPEMLQSLRGNYRPLKVVYPYHIYIPR